MDVKKNVREEVEKELKFGMDNSAEEVFNEIYARTIQNGLAHGNWKKDQEWVLKQVRFVARCAQRKAGSKKITGKHLAQAANCIIPAVAAMCKAQVQTPSFGDWCVGFDEYPEV